MKVLGVLKRILLVMGRVIIRLLILGLIPLNMYVLKMDEALAVILSVVWIILVTLLEGLIRRNKSREKKIKRVLGRVLYTFTSIVVILFMVYSTYFNMYWNSNNFNRPDYSFDSSNLDISREDALEDFDFTMKYIKKIHPLTKDGLPEDIAKKADEVRAEISSRETIKGYELAREIESVLYMFHDGHTHVSETVSEYHYMKYIYVNKKAGAKLIGINGMTYEEFLEEHPGLISSETKDYEIAILKNRITNLEGLRYLGIDISGDITYNYVSADGEPYDVVVTSDEYLTYDEYIKYSEEVTGDDLSSDEETDFVYYEINEEDSLGIFTLDSCEYNKHYKEVLKEFFEEVYSKGITNVAVDLRNNSGGSSLVANEFISYLDVDEYMGWSDEIRVGPLYFINEASTIKNNKKGHGFSGNVYVLTSAFSYSSAMDFAMLIEDNGIGEVIGEPCGNLPASYGEIAVFELPNSKLVMQVSSKKWHRVDTTKENEPIMPDYPCESKMAMEELDKILEENN